MNRRSVLRWLGLAPVAAPAAVAAAHASAEAGVAIIDRRSGEPPAFTFDGRTGTLTVPGLRLTSAPTDAKSWMEARCETLPDGRDIMLTPDGRAWIARTVV